MSEPTFYSHCEEPSCDLGYVEYDCPLCGRITSDYGDLWFRRDEVYGGDTVTTSCSACGASLLMREDSEGFPEIVPGA